MRFGDGTNQIRGWWNLATGAAGTPANVGAATGATESIQDVGNGWYRCVLSGSVNGGVTAYAINGFCATADGSITRVNNSTRYMWGIQFELGAFSTSYIPTVASQVTRSADAASVNTLSPWYNATEGTLYAEYTPYAVTSDSRFASIDDNTSANRIMIWGTASSARTIFNTRLSSVDQADLQVSSTYTTSTSKAAGSYKVNDFAFSVNGGAVLTDTSGTIPTVTQLVIGSSGASTAKANGHIRRITYYPRRLSNAELQAITA
jgi:hypothetical protein